MTKETLFACDFWPRNPNPPTIRIACQLEALDSDATPEGPEYRLTVELHGPQGLQDGMVSCFRAPSLEIARVRAGSRTIEFLCQELATTRNRLEERANTIAKLSEKLSEYEP